MSGRSPDVLMDPTTLDLPAFTRHASGMETIAQRVRIRLTTLLGDWPLDQSAGIDWISILGSKPFDAEATAALLAIEMTDTPGVTGIEDMEFAQDGQRFEMSAKLLTQYDEGLPVVVQAPGIDGNLSIAVGGTIGHSERIAP